MSTFNIHDNKSVTVNNYEATKEKKSEVDKERNRIKLFGAAMSDDIENIEKQLKECYVDMQDFFGSTALIFATICDCENAVRTLLKAGANPTLTDSKGRNALNCATSPKIMAMLSGNTK